MEDIGTTLQKEEITCTTTTEAEKTTHIPTTRAGAQDTTTQTTMTPEED